MDTISATKSEYIRYVALALCFAAFWSLLGRYYGLQDDAMLYALQGLANLQPEPFVGDLYLKFGSQDDFTIYSNLSGWLIGRLGIDHGSAALTFISVALWYVSAWFLARALVGRDFAWLATGLLLTTPGWYGAGQVFELVERFLNPRLLAEAIGLLAIWAMVRGRLVVTALLLAVAMTIHPLMAVPVIAIAAIYLSGNLKRSPGIAVLSSLLVVGTLGVAYLIGRPSSLITGDWLAAVRSRSGFLFLDSWEPIDWHIAALPLATLALVTATSSSITIRRLAGAAASVATAGLVATAFVTWALPIKVAIQIQPWRWSWVATFLAIVFLPITLSLLWRQKASGRAAAVLLITAWVLGDAAQSDDWIAVAGILVSLAALTTYHLRSRLPDSTAHLMLIGSGALLTCTLIWICSLAASEVTLGFDFGGDAYWLQRAIGVLRVPAVAALAVLTMWLMLRGGGSLFRPAIASTCAIALLAAGAPGWWASWSSTIADARTRAAFSEWRDIIGKDQEVLWPEGLQWTWFAMERRSFLTLSQLSGIVFSEPTTVEARRRAALLAASYPPGAWFNESNISWATKAPATREEIVRVCSATEVGYFVARVDVGLAVRSAEWPNRGKHIYLYDCARLRGS